MKRILSVILTICLMFSLWIPISADTANTPIKEVVLYGIPDPVAGQKPNFSTSSIKAPSGAHYSVVGEIEWADPTKPTGIMDSSDTFKSGGSYYATMVVKADDGYGFPFTDRKASFSISMNGMEGHADPEDGLSNGICVWIEMKEGASTSSYTPASKPTTTPSETTGTKPTSTTPGTTSKSPETSTTTGTPAAATIKTTATTVKAGKKTTVKVTASSGAKITVSGNNKNAKDTHSVSISKPGKTVKLTFSKKAKKGAYKFKATCAASGNYKAVSKVITIKVK